MKKRKNQGQSLIEVLTALAIAILVIVTLVAGVTYAIRNLTHAKNQALATQYAQEGIELARKARDEIPATFFTDGSCNIEEPLGVFSRERWCVLDGEMMDVRVEVNWSEGSKTHVTTLETKLSNWR